MSYRRKHISPKIRILKNRKKFIKKHIFWIFLGFLIIIVTILFFVLFSQKFQIQKIDISGNEKIESRNIENLAWLNVDREIFKIGLFGISTKSIFIIDTKNLIKNILNEFPGIEGIEVQKKLPQDVILKIKEREPFAIFCKSFDSAVERCFFLDEKGIIFEELQNFPKDMVILRQLPSDEIFVKENIVDKNIVDAVYKVGNNLKNNFQINIKEVFISNPLIFKTSENWQIYFDPTSDIDLQITKMNILLKDEILADNRKNIQYIYLQYKDRAYYK